ncbi:MAG: hypothetical protein JWO80_5351, partial [Bryobacterales bacterium]|nr:hypothetical protein [Bryobacterales bacterium]
MTMSKPRLLIPISLQFSVRYLLRTGLLDQISSFCEPVVLLGWQDPELEKELREKAEVHSMAKSTWGTDYERTRSLLNVWHQKKLASPSTPIRERRANLDRPFRARVRRRLRNAVRGAIVSFPATVRSLHLKEAELMWTDTNAPEVEKKLTALRADAIFSLTPFLQDEELAMRICSRAGLPS